MDFKGKTNLEISHYFAEKYGQEIKKNGLTDIAKVYCDLQSEYHAKYINSTIENFNNPKKSFFSKIKEALLL